MITREHELALYKIRWLGQPKEQVIEEFASYCLETKRIPDPYYFIMAPEGKLFSPSKKALVKESIETETRVGKLEYQAFRLIENHIRENDSGVIVWISPPSPGRYPVSKVIVSEILKEGKVKVLFNRAVVLDISGEDCLMLASALSLAGGRSTVFFNPDDLRACPIILKHPNNAHWTHVLGEFIDLPDVWESIRNGRDLEIKKDTLLLARKLIEEWFGGDNPPNEEGFAKKGYEMNLLGASPVSCPPILGKTSAFGIFFENARLLFESSFPCPKCDHPIPSGKGIIICPHCGAKKEDYGRCA